MDDVQELLQAGRNRACCEVVLETDVAAMWFLNFLIELGDGASKVLLLNGI